MLKLAGAEGSGVPASREVGHFAARLVEALGRSDRGDLDRRPRDTVNSPDWASFSSGPSYWRTGRSEMQLVAAGRGGVAGGFIGDHGFRSRKTLRHDPRPHHRHAKSHVPQRRAEGRAPARPDRRLQATLGLTRPMPGAARQDRRAHQKIRNMPSAMPRPARTGAPGLHEHNAKPHRAATHRWQNRAGWQPPARSPRFQGGATVRTGTAISKGYHQRTEGDG